MFDIGFSELMVIAVIALVVIGPERLPRVARTLGHLAGRLQRYVSDVKADINREIELDELRKMRDSMQQAASSLGDSVKSGLASAETEINRITESAQEALKDPSEVAHEETSAASQAAIPDPQEADWREREAKPAQVDAKAQEEAKPPQAVGNK
jgi:sec-independent protein translocase protein TatB